MKGRARHLHDDRLFDCFVAERSGERLDPPAAEHLADCAACASRYDELRSFLGGLRAEADGETDALFSDEWLRAQQHEIARRIEHLGHGARVISFPAHPVATGAHAHSGRVTPRWVAAAAAAGLFVGVGVGSFFQSNVRLSRVHAAPASAPARPSGGSQPSASDPSPAQVTPLLASAPDPPGGASAPDSNDEFLSELELALDRPRTRELLALDELTPHVRQVLARPGP